MFTVLKRDGTQQAYDITKISSAIKKAFIATKTQMNDDIIGLLALRTTAEASNKTKDGAVSVEDIQDAAEKVLSDSGYTEVAKAYILYRKNHENKRLAENTLLNYKRVVDNYLNVKDWRVKENSTVPYSLGGLILGNSGAITANYWLSEVYDKDVADAHKNADLHIHDLSMLSGYCFTGDTAVLLADGAQKTFRELVNEGVSTLKVLAYNTATDEVVEASAVNPTVTRSVADLVKITFINGVSISCTEDHPFLTRSGEYIPAKDINTDTLLVPAHVADPDKCPAVGLTVAQCVQKVEHIHLPRPIRVYDLTVPVYHNFALAAGVFVHNCAGWSLKQLIQEGLGGVPGKITSSPARHLSTLCNQMVNFLGIMQNEWAGAQAFSSFDTYLAPFVKEDSLTYKQTKQCIQSFVYGVNTPSRWGTQAPFTNITLDWTVPSDLADLPCIVGGEELPYTYKDCQKEMDMINRAFIETMIEGDANGRGFQYPIPTYSITKDFDWSPTDNNKLLFEMTAKYGTPYFSNYVNSDMEPSDIRSMCCRLRLDLRELRKKGGGYFGSGESTGSVGVVTLNMPRIAYLAKDKKDFYDRLDRLMDTAARSLRTKRQVITQYMENGLYPYTKHYLGGFGNHFSTIGLVGMNEACLNAKWVGCDLTRPAAQEFTKQVLNHMRERLSDYQEKYGDLYNLEATPAESTCFRLAKHDKEKYPDIITANQNGTPYYTNSSHLPVGFTEDVFSALDIEDDMQVLYTSGTVFHAFLGEKLPDWQAAMSLVRKIAENYKLPYYTISPTYSVCSEHGYLTGESAVCPYCGKPTEVYSRITGYYRPVQNWNDGKQQEFKDRRVYDIGHSTLRHHAEAPADKVSNAETPCVSADIALPADRYSLFTTSTCPNCKLVKGVLQKRGVEYNEIIADANPETAAAYNIRQAPTLYVPPEGDESPRFICGAPNILAFLRR